MAFRRATLLFMLSSHAMIPRTPRFIFLSIDCKLQHLLQQRPIGGGEGGGTGGTGGTGSREKKDGRSFVY